MISRIDRRMRGISGRKQGNGATGSHAQRVSTSGQSGLALSSRSARCGGQPRAAQALCGLTPPHRLLGGNAASHACVQGHPHRGHGLGARAQGSPPALPLHPLPSPLPVLRSGGAISAALNPSRGRAGGAPRANRKLFSRPQPVPTVGVPHITHVLANWYVATRQCAAATPGAPGTAVSAWLLPGEGERLPSVCGNLSHPAAGSGAPAAPPSQLGRSAPVGAGLPSSWSLAMRYPTLYRRWPPWPRSRAMSWSWARSARRWPLDHLLGTTRRNKSAPLLWRAGSRQRRVARWGWASPRRLAPQPLPVVKMPPP